VFIRVHSWFPSSIILSVTKLRTIIVDDEPLARERLRAMLTRDGTLLLIGECGNGPDAIAAIRGERPDIVFLDVQMPGCDGLQVVSELDAKERPVVIFVTAHDKFAVEAFAVQAVDYLLKPFDLERLQTAIQRAIEHLRVRRADELGTRLESLLAGAPAAERKTERLTVRADGRVVFLRPEEIVWIEAADNYIVIHQAGGERVMVRETLSALEERLGATGFARVNRSAIVNVDQIKELQPTFHGDYTVVLRDGTKVPLSRSLRGKLGTLIADDK
jgi:two-component system LytT family response regulator